MNTSINYDKRYLWRDPLRTADRGGDQAGGPLLSDQIRFYVKAVRLIEWETFDDEAVRPAAYDLHIGSEYYVNDEPVPKPEGDSFEIPPNGLVYVKSKESFNIPYYMIGRYSLRVTQVYRGLLIDNGLHIDPGYHGHIFVPVHNFTDQQRHLKVGSRFFSVEFSRTTPLPREITLKIQTEEELIAIARAKQLLGESGEPVRLFYSKPEDLARPGKTPRDFWNEYPGESHKSAMIGTEQRLADATAKLDQNVSDRLQHFQDQMDRRVESLRTIGFWAGLGLILALLGILLPFLYARLWEVERTASTAAADAKAAKESLRNTPVKVEPAPQPATPVPQKSDTR